MNMKVLCAAELLLAFIAPAADFSGTWLGEIPFGSNAQRLHSSQQFAIRFEQSGIALAGKLYGEYDSPPLLEGKVIGETVDFIVLAQEQQGNQINQSRLHFKGTLKADGTLELTRVRESSNNAGNKGDYQANKPSANQQIFIAKRLTK